MDSPAAFCMVCLGNILGIAIVQCETKELMDEKEGWKAGLITCGSGLILCCCIGAAFNRQKVREKHKIEGSFLKDCLMYIVCAP
jgi:Cys-rich protein (TIGR01571 family)